MGGAMGGVGAWLLAEAVRIHEDAAGAPPDAAAAEAVARRAGGDLEHRILVRAREVGRRLGLSAALERIRTALTLAAAAVLILAALAGILAAGTVMGPGGGTAVNFFVVLFAALGPQSAALLLWLVLALARSTRAAGLLGRAAASLAGSIVRLSHRDAVHMAALRAAGGAAAGSAYGRWSLGAVTHAAWLVFLAALLAMVVFLLSTRSYVFVWETTILSADTYVPLTRWLASVPSLLGFSTPEPAQIRASQWVGGVNDQAALARDAWAQLLVGSIVVYGMAPRLALLAACLLLRARAGRRLRLDTARPGYARLAPRLMPAAEGIGFVDSDAGIEPTRPRADRDGTATRLQPDPEGPVAALGLEIDMPAGGWPPPFGAETPLDLGRAEGRRDMERAITALRNATPRPRLLVLVCALTTTPDRGLRARIDAVMAASAIPLILLLTGGQRLRERVSAESAMQRIADWRALAVESGIAAERVVEVDLDHLTAASRARLAAVAGGAVVGAGASGAAAGRLERAFARIAAAARQWTAPPGIEVQSELHRDIARLYQESGGGLALLEPFSLTDGDLAARLRTGSERLIGLLPHRLALDPRWLSAGALAGALGCVAVATLAVPAAITGLPLWAGLGAALTAALRTARRGNETEESEAPPEIGDAVRAAALLALVLEAQGHDEAAITRMIDAAIGDETPALAAGAEIDGWLDRVRRRYRDAERREARPR